MWPIRDEGDLDGLEAEDDDPAMAMDGNVHSQLARDSLYVCVDAWLHMCEGCVSMCVCARVR